MKRTPVTLAIVTALGISASAFAQSTPTSPQTQKAQPQTKQTQTQTPSTQLAKQDRKFVRRAQWNENYIIEMSRMLTQKATDQGVMKVASALLADHTTALQNLNRLAMEKGVSQVKAPTQKQQAKLKEYTGAKSNQLVQDYLTEMEKRLNNEIGYCTGITKGGRDQAVVAYASSRLPTLRVQLKQLQDAKHTYKPAGQG